MTCQTDGADQGEPAGSTGECPAAVAQMVGDQDVGGGEQCCRQHAGQPRELQSLAGSSTHARSPLRAELLHVTDRQSDVLRLVPRGLSNLEIAGTLHLAESTVQDYVSEMRARHGLRDRTQLVVLAHESGLVRVGT